MEETLREITGASAELCRTALSIACDDLDQAAGLILNRVIDEGMPSSDAPTQERVHQTPQPADVSHASPAFEREPEPTPELVSEPAPAEFTNGLQQVPSRSPPRPIFHFGKQNQVPPTECAPAHTSVATPAPRNNNLADGAPIPAAVPAVSHSGRNGNFSAAGEGFPREGGTPAVLQSRTGDSAVDSESPPASSPAPEPANNNEQLELPQLRHRLRDLLKAQHQPKQQRDNELADIRAKIERIESSLAVDRPPEFAPDNSDSSSPDLPLPPADSASTAAVPVGLDGGVDQLSKMGFPSEEARQALLMLRRAQIGPREITQAAAHLCGAQPYDENAYVEGDYDDGVRADDEPPPVDPTDEAAVSAAIAQLIAIIAPSEEHQTDEYRLCYRQILEKDTIEWSVGRAAEYLFSRAGDRPMDSLLALLPGVLLGVRHEAQILEDIAVDPDIVWEWENDEHRYRFGVLRGDGHEDENTGWSPYDTTAMRVLDAEYAKDPHERGQVIVRSGGAEYLVEVGAEPMYQVAVHDFDSSRDGPLRQRQVRRRTVIPVCGPLAGRGELLQAYTDNELCGRGDTAIVPQAYCEHLSLFRVGRRNRAAVYRVSRQTDPTEDSVPSACFVGGVDFCAEESTIGLPPWISRALGIHNDCPARVRVEPWLLPAVKAVKLRGLTKGFEEMVCAAAESSAGNSSSEFDVTTILSRPMSLHYTSLTQGTIIPIVCSDGKQYEFEVLSLRDNNNEETSAVDIKSVFHAEIELDMVYLSSDVAELQKQLNIPEDRAWESLKRNGYNLLSTLKAEEELLQQEAASSRRQHARLIQSLCAQTGATKSEAEFALASCDWSIDKARCMLAEEREKENPTDGGENLRRLPSANTLRNRRLGALDRPNIDTGTASAPEPEPQEPAEEELSRLPSANTLRSRRLAAISTSTAAVPDSTDGNKTTVGTMLEPESDPEPEPELEPHIVHESSSQNMQQDGSDEDAGLFRLPSQNTLRRERIAALERRA